METLETHMLKMQRFAEHPHIRPLGAHPNWTISTNEKMPIDMYLLETFGQVLGCKRDIPLATNTLGEVRRIVPAAANFALYLEGAKFGVCVLDIEPECSMELKAEFLRCPCLYVERSMSGKGFHMLLEYPYEFMQNHPDTASKTVLKDKERGFEFLFDHWVTFTGNRVVQTDVDFASRKIETELAAVSEKQAKIALADVDIVDVAPDDVVYEAEIATYIGNRTDRILSRSPQDYDGDMSRFEFAVICSILHNVRAAQGSLAAMDHADPAKLWDDQSTAYLVYINTLQLLEHRPKHDERRAGLPMLLYLVKKAMSIEAANNMQDDGNDVVFETPEE